MICWHEELHKEASDKQKIVTLAVALDVRNGDVCLCVVTCVN
jgi:hypothetical protein